MATLEQASKCPRCKFEGTLQFKKKVFKGGKTSTLHSFMCMNESCPWYETGWLVQENEDGSIPEREKGHKEFEPISPSLLEVAEHSLDQLEREVASGEVRPFGR